MGNGVVSAEPNLRSRGAKSLGAAAPTPPMSSSASAFSRSAEFCRAIVESSDDAIIGKTLDGIVRSWNPGAERIFGYAATEMIGRSIRPLIPAELLAEDHFVLLEIEQGYRVPHFDTVRIAKDGRRIPVSLAVSPIHDSNGVVIGASKVARDIGERKQAEAAANRSALEARREAERADRAKTEFLAAMSDEMRAPLTSVSRLADLLLKSDDLNRDQRRYLELMRTTNDALLTIVDDIFDFSKVDSGNFEPRRRSFSPRSLVHDGLKVAHAWASPKNLRLRYFVDPDIPDCILGDEARLRQILLHLVGNAIKFTTNGAIEVKVSSERAIDGGKNIRFAVSDSGIGIAAEWRDRLFLPFWRANGSIGLRRGGTGLGLATCKRLVELMGGDIGVASAVGQGSTFWFALAMTEAHASAAQRSENLEPADGEAGHARILVVDDIDANREIVEAYLEGRGYRVESVGAALDAIQMLGTEPFDLVLMDIQMPIMDGVTATKRIRALPKPMSDVPILAMTGNVLPMQIKSFLDAGMNGHIAKPISRAKLHESVRRWGWRRNSPLPEPAPSASADEDCTIDELVAVVGVERARKIANDFSNLLNGAFRPDCTLAEARSQAHGLINCAGILGLPRFVEACRALEREPASESSALARIRAERGLARDILSGQLLPRLQDRVFRPTGSLRLDLP